MTPTNFSAINSFENMLVAANTNSPFWLGMLITIFAIFFLTFATYGGFIMGLLAASFIGFIIGLLLAYMGLVAWTWVLMIFGLLIFSILYIAFSKKD